MSISARYISEIDCCELLKEVMNIPFEREGDYIEMAAKQSSINLLIYPLLAKAVQEIADLRKLNPAYILVNKLLPKKVTPWHKDFLKPTPLQSTGFPTIERWHLPLFTNNDCSFELRNFVCKPTVGEWWGCVPYWQEHRVCNNSKHTRVHLIVDLDTKEKLGKYE